ncbi:two-component sensor histidine kinase, partial [Campylobacter upsaliensis]|nr:two-component sensor histidine kinase [Campylobacter upsaliensis]
MQKKLFSIIFSVIFALVFLINAFLILSEEEFFIGQDFSWLLSCVLAEFFLVFLCSF